MLAASLFLGPSAFTNVQRHGRPDARGLQPKIEFGKAIAGFSRHTDFSRLSEFLSEFVTVSPSS